MTQSAALKVLVVEDMPDEAELSMMELSRSGLQFSWSRVSDANEYRTALKSKPWDVIVSDYMLPGFSAPAALKILKEEELDVPFIIVSGSIGEEFAVRAMKAGAHDFFPKSNLKRLASAIEREVREAEGRRERRLTSERLKQAEEQFRIIVENVRDHAIFLLDVDGRIASWNAGAQRTTGYRDEEVLGKTLPFLLPEEATAIGREKARTENAASRGSHFEEGWCQRKDGSRFWAESSLHPILDAGQLRGFSGVIKDVSERKRFVDDLRQAVKARDEFLSIASHELKTPLTSLQLQVESLKNTTATRAPLSQQFVETLSSKLEVISRQSHRLTSLINSMLDVTRITSGRMVLARETVDLADIVRDVISRSQDAIRTSGSELRLKIDQSVKGLWDKLRLEQVITNLLANALKYGEGKPIDLTLEGDGQRARLTVVDRGIGIAPTEQARIFERFERAVPQTHYGGFGIGLWIVRQTVEAHGGSIRVDSREKQGSTFVLEFPCEPPA